MRSSSPRYRLIASLLCLLALATGCGADDDDGGAAGTPATPGGTGGTAVGPMSGAAAAPATAGTPSTTTAGTGTAGTDDPAGSGGSAGGAGSAGSARSAGSGGDAGSAGSEPSMPPRPTECAGKPLPERARGSALPAMIGPAAAGLEPYWPTAGWRMAEPAMLGLDATKLQAAVDFETANANTQAVMVIRHGYVAAEKYFGSFTASSRHESYSMAKSFSSALIGIAIEAKLIPGGVDEKICKYYPDSWDCDDASDLRSKITVKHAMNISTGLRWTEDWRSNATGTNDAINLNMLNTALGREAVDEPGTKMRYSTGDPALLTGVIQGATGKNALAYAQDVLFGPIGTPGIRWNSDSSGRTNTYAGLQATAQEYAKFGYLYLNNGLWDGKQIVPAAWVKLTTQGDDPCTDWYRYLWHQNPPVRLGTQDPSCGSLFCPPTALANLPPEAFFAEGVNGQFIFVVPSADMVIVRLAADGPGSEKWDEFAKGFLSAVLDAIVK